jgi:membrane protein implicated in regulation of membrane protease activity
VDVVTPRARLLSFGGAGLVIVIGGVAGPLLGGITGEAIAIALISVGAIAIVSLVFLEVGRSEDRERARERAAQTVRRRPLRRRRRPD